MSSFSFSYLLPYKDFFIEGIINTLGLAAIGVIMGSILGTLLALMRMSKFSIVRFISTAYIEFIRGTPMMVQVYFVFYALPLIFNMPPSFSFSAGALAIGLNSGAYVAEIVRAGIQSIDKGQMEAARSLGMGHTLSMSHIILPQAIRNILPALGNEFVVVIKESSIVSVVGVGELMYRTKAVNAATYTTFRPLIVASLVYFVLTFTISKILGVAERRMARSER